MPRITGSRARVETKHRFWYTIWASERLAFNLNQLRCTAAQRSSIYLYSETLRTCRRTSYATPLATSFRCAASYRITAAQFQDMYSVNECSLLRHIAHHQPPGEPVVVGNNNNWPDSIIHLENRIIRLWRTSFIDDVYCHGHHSVTTQSIDLWGASRVFIATSHSIWVNFWTDVGFRFLPIFSVTT